MTERRSSRSDRGSSSSRGSSRGSSSRYTYRNRSADDIKKRGDQGGNDFDSFVDSSVKMFKPSDGDNCIRILPPTWDDANHFGFDIFMHYDVGPDSQSYLCLHKMKGEDCPICEEREKASKEGDSEYADKLKPVKRIMVYLIDRNDEKTGLQAWSMPWTFDRDLCKLMVDKKTGELLPIDHPEEGYDVEFERKGKGTKTQYIGTAIARRSSELDNDEALDEAVKMPLPDALTYYSYEHIQKEFSGSGGKKSHKDDDDDDKDMGKDRGRGSSRSRSSEPEMPTFDEVHEMAYEELCALIDEHELDINADDSANDNELADWICEDLKIEKKQTRAARSRDDDSASDKMSGLRSRRNRD